MNLQRRDRNSPGRSRCTASMDIQLHVTQSRCVWCVTRPLASLGPLQHGNLGAGHIAGGDASGDWLW